MTPVHSQLLQKQLEQPLKMENPPMVMQPTMQNQPQIQQMMVQKPLQNVSICQFIAMNVE